MKPVIASLVTLFAKTAYAQGCGDTTFAPCWADSACNAAWIDHLAAGGIYIGGASATDGIRATGAAGAAFADCVETMSICAIPGAACMDPTTGNAACTAAYNAFAADTTNIALWNALLASDVTGTTFGNCLTDNAPAPPPAPAPIPNPPNEDGLTMTKLSYGTADCSGEPDSTDTDPFPEAPGKNGECRVANADEAYGSQLEECHYFGGASINHYASVDCTGDTYDQFAAICAMDGVTACTSGWPEGGELEEDTCIPLATFTAGGQTTTIAVKVSVEGCPMSGWFIAFLVFLVLGAVGGAVAFMFTQKMGPFAEKAEGSDSG